MRYYVFQRKLYFLLMSITLSNGLRADQLYLDVTFGTNGVVTTTHGQAIQANASALQSDGKIVVAGDATVSGDSKFIIARYNIDGSLDTAFGTNGIVTASLGSSVSVSSVVIQSTGKIVVGGFSNTTGTTQMFVARFSSTGSLDTSFGTSGLTTISIGDGSTIRGLALQSNDYIVIAGAAVIGGQAQFAAARCTDAGALDINFNTTGYVTTAIGSSSVAHALAIQSDGKIVLAGNSDNRFAVARYSSTGSLDTANFGSGNGYVVTTIGGSDEARSIKIQSDDKLVASGFSDNSVAAARYATDGSLDTNYGTSGVVLTVIGTSAEGRASVMQSDDKLAVTGISDDGLFILRYTSAGALDSAFGISGVLTNLTGDQSEANTLLLQTNGKFVVAGLSDTNMLLIRYLASNAKFISILSPLTGSTITTGHTATISGVASDTGATVAVTVNSNSFGTFSTDSNGRWNAGTSPLLNDGANSVSVTLTVSGNQVASDLSNFTVSAAHVIAITTPAANSTITTSTTSVTGTSTKASGTVEVAVDSTNLTPVSTDSSGNWNAGVTANLVNGAHTIAATLKNGATTLATTSNNITVAAPSKVTISTPTVASTLGLTTTVNGTASEASSYVHVFINGVYFKTVSTDSSGNWTAGTSLSLNFGSNSFNAHLINSVGNILASATNQGVR